METTVTTLLRDFPKVRRAALSGERVLVRTREGDLWITAARPSGKPLVGSLRGLVTRSEDDLDEPTAPGGRWKPTL